jgi:hypothetical protein
VRPNQIQTLKNIAKILSIIIAVYFVYCHPLFTFILVLIVIVLGIILLIYLPKISQFIEDFVDDLNSK